MYKNKQYMIVIILLILVMATDLHAQIVNVQSLLLKEQEGLSLGFTGKGTLNSGNTSFVLIEGSALVRYLVKKHTFLLSSSGAYGTNQENVFATKLFEHFRYRFNISSVVGIESFLQHEYNPFKRLSLRALVGVGPRLKISIKEILTIFLGTSYMFEINQFSENQKGKTYKDAGEVKLYHRWSNYLTLYIRIQKILEIIHTTYVQPAFDNFDNYRLLFDTTLALKVNNWFKFTITHNHAFQSVRASPLGIQRVDTSLLIGISLSLGWQKKQKKSKKKGSHQK